MVLGSSDMPSSSSDEICSSQEVQQKRGFHGGGDAHCKVVAEATMPGNTANRPAAKSSANDKGRLERVRRSASSSSGLPLVSKQRPRWADMDDCGDESNAFALTDYHSFPHFRDDANAHEENAEVAKVTVPLDCFEDSAPSEADLCSSPDFGVEDASTDASCSKDDSDLDSDEDDARDAENGDEAPKLPCPTPDQFERRPSFDSADADAIPVPLNSGVISPFGEIREPTQLSNSPVMPAAWCGGEPMLHTPLRSSFPVDPNTAMYTQHSGAAVWGCVLVAYTVPLPVSSLGYSHLPWTLEVSPVASSLQNSSLHGQHNEAANSALASVHSGLETPELATVTPSDLTTLLAYSGEGHPVEQIDGSTEAFAEQPKQRRRRSEEGQRKQRERHMRRLAQRQQRRALKA